MCMMALGAVVSAVGSIASGMAESSMAKYNAKVAKINADQAYREGIYKAGIVRRQYDEVASEQQAALAKSGVVLERGSPNIVAIEQGFRTEQAAGIEIWRGQTEQTKYLNEAKAYKAQAKAAKMSGFIGAIGSLVGGLSGMGSGTSATGGKTTGPVSLGVGPSPSVKPVSLFSSSAPGYLYYGGPR